MKTVHFLINIFRSNSAKIEMKMKHNRMEYSSTAKTTASFVGNRRSVVIPIYALANSEQERQQCFSLSFALPFLW